MKHVYGFLGLLCFGIGAIGIVLPVLPTTPFLLLATFFFARGSGRFHRWFLSSKLYQRHLNSFVTKREMPLKTKLCILLPASAMLVCAFLLMNKLPGKIVILLLIIFKYWYFFARIKTIAAVTVEMAPVEEEKGDS